MKRITTLAAAGALLLAACGSDSAKTASPTRKPASPATTAAASATAKPGASPSAAVQATQTGGKKTYSAAPPMTIDPNKQYFATIKMDIGDIRLELYPKDAPVSVNNFVFLARDGYYDGVTFHRVIPGFVAQAGDPLGTGLGGPGYTIKDEVNARKFVDGTLGMAKTSAPNSAGSQWFIDYAPQPRLDGGYTVFGQLVSGRDVLDKITPHDPTTATQPGTKINTILIEEQ
ncbi:MAG: peptidylprolyl isomerase [Chloroflexota bacterium]|nr:peptidylprolyl isomerase [Chloroflexota bacterium]